MTRQEAIDRWTDIARTVFKAEDVICDKWYDKLHKAASEDNKEELERIAEEYCQAIAVEIVSNITDEALARMELNNDHGFNGLTRIIK